MKKKNNDCHKEEKDKIKSTNGIIPPREIKRNMRERDMKQI